MEVKIFVADCEFIPDDNTMLKLEPGDQIEVLLAEDNDWWYGKITNISNNNNNNNNNKENNKENNEIKEGWFPPTYGHLILTTSSLNSIFNRNNNNDIDNNNNNNNNDNDNDNNKSNNNTFKLSLDDLFLQRLTIFKNLIEREKIFIEQMKIFIDKIVKPIEYQDTNFKRTFLSEPSIALSFSLYTKLWNLCSTFLKALYKLPLPSTTSIGENLDQIAACFAQFAPSLRLFAQYIAENSNTLNAIKSFGVSLNNFLDEHKLPTDTSIETYLVLPVEHYSHYISDFDMFVYLSTCLLVEKQKLDIDGLSSMRVNIDSLDTRMFNNSKYLMKQESNQAIIQQITDEKAVQDLKEACDVLQGYTNEVDEKLVNESRKHILLAVETQFVNNAKIFNPDREYITEGELELVRLDSNTAPKLYHAHLFNDALVLSTRITGFTGKFKFVRAIDLSVAILKQVSSQQLTNAFCLEINLDLLESNDSSIITNTNSQPEIKSYIFHCRSRSGLEWWMTNIQNQLQKLSQRIEEKNQQRAQKRGSMIKIAKRASVNWSPASSSNNNSNNNVSESIITSLSTLSTLPTPYSNPELLNNVRLSVKQATTRIESIQGEVINPLKPRTQFIINYLTQEFQFQKKLLDFQQIAIEPLINSSKGAELQIGLTDDEKDQLMIRKGSDQVLFERRGSYFGVFDSMSSKKQSQLITELLSDSNLQIFLSTIENITITIMEFLLLIEVSLTNVKFNDSIIVIGSACISTQAETLYQLMLSYAGSYHSGIRIFSNNNLLKFKNQIEEKLKRQSGVISILVSVLNFPDRLKVFLTRLHDITPLNHPDHTPLDNAIQKLSTITTDMQNLLQSKVNYEKLLSIQNSFLFSFFQPEPFFDNFITNQRKFVREGDLIKICRKENKEYRFWLFNDSLIYGKLLPIGKYKLHRVIRLISICNVQSYSIRNGLSIQYSFIVNSIEKSFILIANSEYERNSWINDINKYCNIIIKAATTTTPTIVTSTPSISTVVTDNNNNNNNNNNLLNKTNDFEILSNNPNSPRKNSNGEITSLNRNNSFGSNNGSNTPPNIIDESIEPAPVWIPDFVTSNCYICHLSLTGVTYRRHHCRKCGNIVCSKHSSKRILLPNINKTQPQRVCDKCAIVIEEYRNSIRLSSDSLSTLSQKLDNNRNYNDNEEEEDNNNNNNNNNNNADDDDEDNDDNDNRREYNEPSRRISMKLIKGKDFLTNINTTTSTDTTTNTVKTPNKLTSETIQITEDDSTGEFSRPVPITRDLLLSQLIDQKNKLNHNTVNVNNNNNNNNISENSHQSMTVNNTNSISRGSVSTLRHTPPRSKIIPAFSVPITFMLTHDSARLRRSVYGNEERETIKDIEIPLQRLSARERSIDGRKPTLSSRTNSSEYNFNVGIRESDRLSRHSVTNHSSSSSSGLLNMLATVMMDERELLKENENDEGNSSDEDENENGDGDDNENNNSSISQFNQNDL